MITAFQRGENARHAIARNLLDPAVLDMAPSLQAIHDQLTQYG